MLTEKHRLPPVGSVTVKPNVYDRPVVVKLSAIRSKTMAGSISQQYDEVVKRRREAPEETTVSSLLDELVMWFVSESAVAACYRIHRFGFERFTVESLVLSVGLWSAVTVLLLASVVSVLLEEPPIFLASIGLITMLVSVLFLLFAEQYRFALKTVGVSSRYSIWSVLFWPTYAGFRYARLFGLRDAS